MTTRSGVSYTTTRHSTALRPSSVPASKRIFDGIEKIDAEPLAGWVIAAMADGAGGGNVVGEHEHRDDSMFGGGGGVIDRFRAR
jgi:hypothetical protein